MKAQGRPMDLQRAVAAKTCHCWSMQPPTPHRSPRVSVARPVLDVRPGTAPAGTVATLLACRAASPAALPVRRGPVLRWSPVKTQATTASRTPRPPVDGMASVMVPANAGDIPSERSVRREGARTPSSTRQAPAMTGAPASRAAAAAAAVRHAWAALAPPGAPATAIARRGSSARTEPARSSAASARAAMPRASVARAIVCRGSAAGAPASKAAIAAAWPSPAEPASRCLAARTPVATVSPSRSPLAAGPEDATAAAAACCTRRPPPARPPAAADRSRRQSLAAMARGHASAARPATARLTPAGGPAPARAAAARPRRAGQGTRVSPAVASCRGYCCTGRSTRRAAPLPRTRQAADFTAPAWAPPVYPRPRARCPP